MGYVWECVTPDAGFVGRDGAALVSHRGALFLLGGWNSSRKDLYGKAATNNEVYRSADGAAWEKICTAPWAPRHTFGCVVFRDLIWVVGGDANAGVSNNDVWNSPDGIAWTKIADSPPWAPRVLQQVVVHNDKIWLLGGQSPSCAIAYAGHEKVPDVFYNDVWNSADGVNWTRVTDCAPWFPRGQIGGGAVLGGKLWILGGGTYDTPERRYRRFFTDVWCSENGADWTLTTPDAGWPVRQYHDVAVFAGRLWVLEGYGGGEYGSRAVGLVHMLQHYKNRNDVWHSADGKTWTELPGTPWPPRHAASVCVHGGALWIVSGNNFDADVWKLTARDDG